MPKRSAPRLEEQSWLATVRSLFFNKVSLAVAVIATAATVIGLAGRDPAPAVGGSQSAGSGNGCANVVGTCNNFQQLRDAAGQAGATAATDDDLRGRLRSRSDSKATPSGDGPWAFVVVDTATEGLFARRDPRGAVDLVGTVPNRQTVWADCQVADGVVPAVDVANDVGGRWLRVRWRHLDAPSVRGMSEPTETQVAWMYRGFLEPLGQNGDLRSC
ncbi:hypothetical protein [Actinokineospora xionganensis]|uniref:PH domain-containing protein n=1 Tax=Actinokineospora xionganensis TaxID=2684470 RepID=A0ABR7L4G2_9PSEU|nr:hypothetical protein [Actinokineospora xionganensis]MBC6447571.1 hypothetical protein [Actinokineospora xionganensis]